MRNRDFENQNTLSRCGTDGLNCDRGWILVDQARGDERHQLGQGISGAAATIPAATARGM